MIISHLLSEYFEVYGSVSQCSPGAVSYYPSRNNYPYRADILAYFRIVGYAASILPGAWLEGGTVSVAHQLSKRDHTEIIGFSLHNPQLHVILDMPVFVQ